MSGAAAQQRSDVAAVIAQSLRNCSADKACRSDNKMHGQLLFLA
jgi:hypothetical protein